MKSPRLKYKTIFISDVHLGLTDCKIDEVCNFLQHTVCEKLVLNGDIIDAWHLRHWGKWRKEHTQFFRLVLQKMEQDNTEVVYLRGNHDDFLWRVMPLDFGRLSICNEHIHETPHGKYICVHGDGFDAVTTNHKWVAMLGGIGYSLLLWVNRMYNWARQLQDKPHFSLSKKIKARVKSAVSFVGKYEQQLQVFALRKQYQGIICGHIHTPADKSIGEVHYLNSGDWLESLTAIVETTQRELRLIGYTEFMIELAAAAEKGGSADHLAGTVLKPVS
ncbi:MAG: UDP-2,3-diacylglucosamine diphosphatase [Verrucomicrobiae bacterium]|nr:UDP-2,3-diacylglucosamine diphosphatase [Verrucomicrobiae bacterium]